MPRGQCQMPDSHNRFAINILQGRSRGRPDTHGETQAGRVQPKQARACPFLRPFAKKTKKTERNRTMLQSEVIFSTIYHQPSSLAFRAYPPPRQAFPSVPKRSEAFQPTPNGRLPDSPSVPAKQLPSFVANPIQFRGRNRGPHFIPLQKIFSNILAYPCAGLHSLAYPCKTLWLKAQ